jgi:glyoxylase-like metal-dependent hydrolase (beta-lactamase superfamily II)
MRPFLTGVMAAIALAAPLAASAQRGPNIQLTAAEGRLEKISDHVHILKAWPNAGIIVGQTGVLVVDTGLGRDNGAVLAREAAKLSTRGQKLYLATTHFHPEHAGGQAGFPATTTVVRARVQHEEMQRDGQAMANRFAGMNADYGRLLAQPIDTRADVIFEREHRLDLGGVSVRLVNLPGGHTLGDTVVLVEPDSVLFAGDLVESLQSPNLNCASCSPKAWMAALDAIAGLNPRIIVPTHGPAPVDASYIGRSKAFLTDVNSRALALKAEGRPPADAGRVVQTEMAAKYPNWNGMQNLVTTVQRAYDNP